MAHRQMLKEVKIIHVQWAELIIGYIGNGYAKVHRVGVCIIAFIVGSLNIINAIARPCVKISL